MRRRALGRAGLVLVPAIVLVAGAELIVRTWYRAGLDIHVAQGEKGRIFADARMFEPVEDGGVRYLGRPGSAVTVRGIEYRHDALGLRDSASQSLTSGSFRVLVLGDSNVYGVGVPADETFCARLERRLNDPPSVRPIDVVNAGIPGYNTRDQLALFRRLESAVAPDLVLIGFFVNDLERLGFHVGYDGHLFCDPLPLPDAWKPTLWRSYLYRKVSLRRVEWYRQSGRYELGEGENLTFSEARLRETIAAVEARGARCAVLDVPMIESTETGDLVLEHDGYRGRAASAWLAGVAADEGVPLLPLLDCLLGEPAPLFWAAPEHRDHHPNSAAHERFAAAIAEFVRVRDLVPGEPR